MAHVRKTLRDAVVASLAGLTTTGTRVYNSRIFPLAQDVLPCLTVYTTEETVDVLNMSAHVERWVTVVVRAYARVAENIENTLDTIAAEVETAFSPGASAKYWTIQGTEVEFDGEGDQAFATITISFAVLYHTARSAPETAL